jgi:hypothetical protein
MQRFLLYLEMVVEAIEADVEASGGFEKEARNSDLVTWSRHSGCGRRGRLLHSRLPDRRSILRRLLPERPSSPRRVEVPLRGNPVEQRSDVLDRIFALHAVSRLRNCFP